MKLAVFDFDGTIFQDETLPFLLTTWKELKYSKSKLFKTYIPLLPLYLRYKIITRDQQGKEEIRIAAIKEFTRLFSNMNDIEVISYFNNTYISMKNLLNKTIVDEINKANDEGYHTVILSGAYSLLLNNFREELKIKSIIATEIYFDKGKFDSNKPINIVSGSNKIAKLQDHFMDTDIDWDNSKAYADSYSDLPLLESVGLPHAVNPDLDLKNIALERNWPII